MASPRETWSLTEHLLTTQEDLFKSATQHPFLLAGAEGRLPKETLGRWLANDRLYIHSYIRAAGKLLASIDLPQQVPDSEESFETQLADWLIEALVAIRKEERFFLDVAERYGLGIELPPAFPPASSQATASPDPASSTPVNSATKDNKLPGLVLLESIFSSVRTTAPPTPSSPQTKEGKSLLGLSLVQSLFTAATTTTTTTTTGGSAPPTPLPWLEGALTFWGTERCYLSAWSWARDKAEEQARGAAPPPQDQKQKKQQEAQGGTNTGDADGGALRNEFIPNWSSPQFAAFVDRLGALIDKAVGGVLEGKKEGEERDKVRAEVLGRVEGKWRTLLEAERAFWPDV